MSGKHVAALVLVLATLMARSVIAQTIQVKASQLIINRTELTLPASETDVLRAVGGAPEVFEPAGDQYSNRVFHWLELGLVAFSNPRTNRVHAFELLYDKPAYWPGLTFNGEVILPVGTIAVSTQSNELPAMCFDDGKEWRCKGMYVLVTSSAKDISLVEIGSEAGGAVSVAADSKTCEQER